MTEYQNYNPQVLAFIGDAIYELMIRKYLIENYKLKINDIQKEKEVFVSAKGQYTLLKILTENNFFDEEELLLINRYRNYKTKSKAKNSDFKTYNHATAFEAILGYFYLSGNEKQNKIMDYIEEIRNREE